MREIPDERLELVFTCCHPALAVDAQVALTLRALGGLEHRPDRPRVPRARGDHGAAVAARQAQDQDGGHPVPGAAAAPAARTPGRRPRRRLPDLRQGYGGSGELAAEALWLGTALAGLLPREPEVHALLALMLLHDSRRDARSRDGDLVLLADQDRSRWDHRQIAAGRAELDRALELGGRGPYLLQALAASLHAEDEPDWRGIAVLYGELSRVTGSPVAALNQRRGRRRGRGAGRGPRARRPAPGGGARRLPLLPRDPGRPAPPARQGERGPRRVRRALDTTAGQDRAPVPPAPPGGMINRAGAARVRPGGPRGRRPPPAGGPPRRS